MSTKILQKDIWYLIEKIYKRFKKLKIKINCSLFVREAVEVIERDNKIKVPIEWVWKLDKRFKRKYC